MFTCWSLNEDKKNTQASNKTMECHWYNTPRGCKFKDQCRFNHIDKISSSTTIDKGNSIHATSPNGISQNTEAAKDQTSNLNPYGNSFMPFRTTQSNGQQMHSSTNKRYPIEERPGSEFKHNVEISQERTPPKEMSNEKLHFLERSLAQIYQLQNVMWTSLVQKGIIQSY